MFQTWTFFWVAYLYEGLKVICNMALTLSDSWGLKSTFKHVSSKTDFHKSSAHVLSHFTEICVVSISEKKGLNSGIQMTKCLFFCEWEGQVGRVEILLSKVISFHWVSYCQRKAPKLIVTMHGVALGATPIFIRWTSCPKFLLFLKKPWSCLLSHCACSWKRFFTFWLTLTVQIVHFITW